MTQKQKAARDKFKKVVIEAGKLRKKNPSLTQAQAVKQAWAISYSKAGTTKKAAAPKKKSAPKKKAASKKVGLVKKNVIQNKKTKLKKDIKLPSEFISLSGYKFGKEIIVGSIGKLSTLKNLVPEVKLRVTRGKKSISDIVTSANVASDIFKKFIGKNKIETQELVAVAYLNTANKVLGVYVHSVGSISSANVDVRLVLAGALQMGSVGLILCHNHPSGNLKPSEADKTITKQLIKATSYHNINVLDHIIITKESHFSFAENGLI